MAIDFVQATGGRQDNSTSAATGAFPANVTTGNLIVVCIQLYNSTTLTCTVTDSQGNTYTQVGSYQNQSPFRAAMFYAKNVTGGANTVTVTPSTTSYTRFIAAEYSGADTTSPLDSSAVNAQSSTQAITTGTITVNNTGSLLISATALSSVQLEFRAGAGACVRGTSYAIGPGAIMQDKPASAASSVGLTYFTNVNTATVGASFKPSSAGGGGGASSARIFNGM